jgi:hypothetical protein
MLPRARVRGSRNMVLDTIRTPKIPRGTDSWCPPLQRTQGWGSLKLWSSMEPKRKGGPGAFRLRITIVSFPVILEHSDACGVLAGKEVRTPTIAATAVILATRGADQILVPCPSSYELERTAAGVELLPPERRSTVKTLDRGGDVLGRVREYLQPLAVQASEWPENAFVSFSEDFLYKIALGAKHRAGILSDAPQVVRGFVPIIRPQRFSGESRFRLAELIALICSYEPHQLDHGSFTLETPDPGRCCTEVWLGR